MFNYNKCSVNLVNVATGVVHEFKNDTKHHMCQSNKNNNNNNTNTTNINNHHYHRHHTWIQKVMEQPHWEGLKLRDHHITICYIAANPWRSLWPIKAQTDSQLPQWMLCRSPPSSSLFILPCLPIQLITPWVKERAKIIEGVNYRLSFNAHCTIPNNQTQNSITASLENFQWKTIDPNDPIQCHLTMKFLSKVRFL